MNHRGKLYLILLLIAGCKERTVPTAQQDQTLYAPPIVVPLDLSQGYKINAITGDTIQPLLNSLGDTVKTGVLLRFNARQDDTDRIPKPRIIAADAPVRTTIAGNVYPLPDKLTIIPVDTTRLKKVKAGFPVAMHITEKIMPFREPQPVKALPLRFKDNSTANIQYLDVDQGMSYSFVCDMIEDKRGNLWFGMDGTGLSKYDGTSFSHYTSKEGLSGDVAYSIIEDRVGNLWIGTNQGLNKFDGQHFTQYLNDETPNRYIISSIIEDSKGNIWATTISGLVRYDGKHFTRFTSREGLPSDTVWSCMEDRKGNIWIGTTRGVAKFDGQQFTLFTKEDGLLSDGISSLFEDRAGNIWMGSNMGISVYDGRNFTYYTQKEGLSSNLVHPIMQDKNGRIWIGTGYGGLNKFDGSTFTHYDLPEGMSNNKVYSLIEDHNGNIWAATDGGGVNKIDEAGLGYLPQNEVLTANRVRPILKDRSGNVWFGTESRGMGRYDASTSTGASTGFAYFFKKNSSYTDGMNLGLRSLYEDRNGNIWVGVEGKGVVKFDGKNYTDYGATEGHFSNTVFDVREDKAGNIWFAKNNDGVSKYDGKSFWHYNEKEGLPSQKVFAVYEDKKGNIWFGMDGAGLSKYDGSHITNYTEKEGLFSKTITSITGDENGNLWLGTLGAGLCQFDGKYFTYYTEKGGLSNNNVWSVIEDSAGHFWVGTNKGLNLFVAPPSKQKDSAANYTIYQFGLEDGLKGIDFNLHSACIDANNRMWWGTGKNILLKDLNVPFDAKDVNSLRLNYIELNGRFYDYRNLPDSISKEIRYDSIAAFTNNPKNLSVAYDLNHFNFHFSAIDWSAPGKIKYSYRMIGLDEKWSEPSGDPIADYRNLSHGKYEFQVKAIGRSQAWSAPTTYSFTIRPAWWQTVWFKALLVLTGLVLVFFIARFIYYYQLRKQKVVMEKQLAVQYERQRISAEMHDDIGAGLSGIRLLAEVTKKNAKDEQAAEEVDKIYQSVADISSKMKEVIWSLNTENDNLENLISYLQRQLRQWLEHYPCRLNIGLPESIPEVQIDGESRRNILLIVKEAIHNIIKHAGATEVNVKLSCNNERLSIVIADNGKGMPIDQSNDTGNGMKNMRERTKKLNGDLLITNAAGLKLKFDIPLQPRI